MNRRVAIGASVLSLLALGVSGCGDDEPVVAPTAPSPTTASPSPSASPSSPSPTAATSATTPAGQVLALAVPASGGARCVVPTPAGLRDLESPFKGTVTGIEGSKVTLTVDRHFDQDAFASAVLTLPATAPLDPTLDLALGDQALIAANGGRVVGCGFSGRATPELTRLYRMAFGR